MLAREREGVVSSGHAMSDERPASQDPVMPAKHSRFAGFHARTYEMELLLSGAVVFALLQLPPLLSVAFDRFRAGLAGDLRILGLYGESYVVFVLYALIGSFLLHLVLRAFWIGLVGLESVYPEGIEWDRLKFGPTTLERYRRDVPSLARAIDRVDDLCSLIFSFGFMVVFIFVYSVVVLAVAAVSGFAISRLLLRGSHAVTVSGLVFVALLGSQVVIQGIDRLLSPRLDPRGVGMRLVRGLVRFGFVISPIRWIGPVQLTLQSRLSTPKVSAALITAVTLLSSIYLGSLLVNRGLIRIDGGRYFPSSLREQGLDPTHYRDRRAPGTVEPRIPSIQSELIEGSYIELSIPYHPRHHDALIATACPDLKPLRVGGIVFGRAVDPTAEHARTAAQCLASLFDIQLDQAPLDALWFDFSIEPGSELEALAARIPVGELPPGRHELAVIAPGRADDDPPEPVRHVIPFWR